MKTITTILLILGSVQIGIAQCNFKIESIFGTVLDDPYTIFVSNDFFWVCANQKVIVDGDDNEVYVEEGGEVEVNGIGNLLVVKGSGSVLINASAQFTVVEYDSDVTVTDNGFDSGLIECTTGEITFDYSTAPFPRCAAAWVGIEETKLNSLRLMTNPVNDVLEIQNPANLNLTAYHIYAMNGQKMLEGDFGLNTNKVDVGELEKGMYVIQLSTEDEVAALRFVVE